MSKEESSSTKFTAWSKRRVHFTISEPIRQYWMFHFSISRSSKRQKEGEAMFLCPFQFSCVYTKQVGARVIRRRIDYKAERRGDLCTYTHTHTQAVKHTEGTRENTSAELEQIKVKAETETRFHQLISLTG